MMTLPSTGEELTDKSFYQGIPLEQTEICTVYFVTLEAASANFWYIENEITGETWRKL